MAVSFTFFASNIDQG